MNSLMNILIYCYKSLASSGSIVACFSGFMAQTKKLNLYSRIDKFETLQYFHFSMKYFQDDILLDNFLEAHFHDTTAFLTCLFLGLRNLSVVRMTILSHFGVRKKVMYLSIKIKYKFVYFFPQMAHFIDNKQKEYLMFSQKFRQYIFIILVFIKQGIKNLGIKLYNPVRP